MQIFDSTEDQRLNPALFRGRMCSHSVSLLRRRHTQSYARRARAFVSILSQVNSSEGRLGRGHDRQETRWPVTSRQQAGRGGRRGVGGGGYSHPSLRSTELCWFPATTGSQNAELEQLVASPGPVRGRRPPDASAQGGVTRKPAGTFGAAPGRMREPEGLTGTRLPLRLAAGTGVREAGPSAEAGTPGAPESARRACGPHGIQHRGRAVPEA